MLFYWLINHNNIVCMFKCLKYHSWASKSGTQVENLAKSNNFLPTYPKQKFDPPHGYVLVIFFLQNFQDIIYTPSRVD